MAPGISYDDSGSLASYFGVTCLAMILIPVTFTTLRPAPKDPHKSLCDCNECRANNKRKAALKSASRGRKLARYMVPLVLGWAALLYLAYGIYKAPPLETTIYDPFEILGIRTSASDKEIKKHYKKLSLQYHPDKVKLGPNQTYDEIENKFVDLTKAYKALTDEATVENLRKYGNPDGPQQREDKIAIPKWVVEGKSSIWVLLAYGVVLGGGIPFVVGRWWFRQRKLTRDGVLNSTAENIFHKLRSDTDFLSLIALLSSSDEFQTILAPRRKLSKKDRKERQARVEALEQELDAKRADLLINENPMMKKDSRVIVTTATARRARALLWAHLLRHDLPKDLAAEQLEVLRALPPLLQAIANIALGHNWLKTSLLCQQLQSALVQAIPIGGSPLAQLPGISLQSGLELEITTGAEGRKWLEKWVAINDEKYPEANAVARNFPRLEVTDVEFKVTGEKVVTPSSIVQLAFKARWVHPKDPKEVSNGSARADSVEAVEKEVLKETKEEKKDYPPTGYAHAPRWPANRSPAFFALMGDSKLDKVIVQPSRVADIPFDQAREYSLQFQAPPQPNLYSFVLHLTSDTYVGADIARPIMLKVEPAPPESDGDDDISEPEEDSIAGQMAMMCGEKVKPSAVHEESEYETDTSSDEEGPRRGRAINEDTDSDSD
ncbi:hypothetical protein CC85DRAFT_289163 [Cutaneotrichosporon oleaginosum]|uniref:J domain-containing protein n=1 Tax=Cutaneotrichosporon oleaginosum TaxID=879819 RepID=A0A0J0XCQ1_9TREE|nr:uncharacterized protein CC85DRAFT_289163 [Cutaneotrichosporon oleaginosum]KLT38837.1 hypothetical protein CC85DRAFT_289163 [Cutaneotrichosporon oleaginosum]TXT04719.1 hypothetical protein COLE_07538 [Cutaneotrichosporon oleaginosum]